MKRFSRSLLVLFVMMALALIPVQTSSAASKYPAKVSKLKAQTVSDTSVKLSWSKVSDATGYSIYSVDPETGAEKKVAVTKSTSYTVNKIVIGQTYKFHVYAYKKVGSKTYRSKSPSNTVTVQTKLSTPGAIKNFRLVCCGDESVFLAWNAATNADKYILYQYNPASEKYEAIATTTETTYQVKKLTAGEKYYFKVQAYHSAQGQEVYGKISDKVSATAKSINVSAVHGRYLNATLKKKVTVTVKSTGKKKTLKKGTAVIATKKSSGTITALLKDGTKISVKGSSLTYGNLYISSTKYSKAQKEAFVNGRGYSSSTNYLIWVSQYTCQANVFKGSKGAWNLVRTMKCVVGRNSNTPVGIFKILNRVGSLNGKPAYFFTWNSRLGGGNAFHCLLNNKTSGALSGGCVRLSESDLKYVGTYCKPGTTVVSY